MNEDNKNTMQQKTAKDFFLHLGSTISLYFTFGSALAIIFAFINKMLPDELSNIGYDYFSWDGTNRGLRFAISIFIVSFPLFVFLTKTIRKRLSEGHRIVRSWLSYFTVFLAGAFIAGDIIALLNTFLSGEITARFALKVISVIILSGLVFWYYLKDIKSENGLDEKSFRLIGYISLVVAILTLVFGFWTYGSPKKQRDIRFDNQRSSDLQMIQNQIVNYWQNKGSLPDKLENMSDPIQGFKLPVDPLTKNNYEYKVVNKTSFNLCAEFSTNSDEGKTRIIEPSISPDSMSTEVFFKHTAGKNCFDRKIDTDFYPVNAKPLR